MDDAATASARLRRKLELLEPFVGLPARRLLQHPHAPEIYPRYLAAGYHVTCAMLELMEAALARARELDAELILVCLSGRGDKDLAEVLAQTKP